MQVNKGIPLNSNQGIKISKAISSHSHRLPKKDQYLKGASRSLYKARNRAAQHNILLKVDRPNQILALAQM